MYKILQNIITIILYVYVSQILIKENNKNVIVLENYNTPGNKYSLW